MEVGARNKEIIRRANGKQLVAMMLHCTVHSLIGIGGLLIEIVVEVGWLLIEIDGLLIEIGGLLTEIGGILIEMGGMLIKIRELLLMLILLKQKSECVRSTKKMGGCWVLV